MATVLADLLTATVVSTQVPSASLKATARLSGMVPPVPKVSPRIRSKVMTPSEAATTPSVAADAAEAVPT